MSLKLTIKVVAFFLGHPVCKCDVFFIAFRGVTSTVLNIKSVPTFRMATKLLRLVQDNKKKDGESGVGGAGVRRKGGRDVETEQMIEEQQQHIRDLEKQVDAFRNKVCCNQLL